MPIWYSNMEHYCECFITLLKSLVNNSTTTITIATSLSLHNESALLNKRCENTETQRQKRVKCVCQLLCFQSLIGAAWKDSQDVASTRVHSCHRNWLSTPVQSRRLFLTSKLRDVCRKILCSLLEMTGELTDQRSSAKRSNRIVETEFVRESLETNKVNVILDSFAWCKWQHEAGLMWQRLPWRTCTVWKSGKEKRDQDRHWESWMGEGVHWILKRTRVVIIFQLMSVWNRERAGYSSFTTF